MSSALPHRDGPLLGGRWRKKSLLHFSFTLPPQKQHALPLELPSALQSAAPFVQIAVAVENPLPL